jgi:hypothetical protein
LSLHSDELIKFSQGHFEKSGLRVSSDDLPYLSINFLFYFIALCLFSVRSLHITLCRAFVNNVWYIKILSPEDVHKMGGQAVESFSPHAAHRLNSSGGEAQDLVSGLPSLGMLEY